MRKRIVDNRIPLVISLVFVLITLCILFYLTFQTPDDTVALSERVGHLPFVENFLNWIGVFVDWSVRQWAHVFEFLIIGICVSIFYVWATKKIWLMPVLAILTCMCISLCDQSVRLFIAGRHFDSFDLVLDALEYVSAIVIVSICRGICGLVVNRDKWDWARTAEPWSGRGRPVRLFYLV